MGDEFSQDSKMLQMFVERMSSGIFAYRADESNKLLFVNHNMFKIYDCVDEEDFLRYVDGSFKGMVGAAQYDGVREEIDFQVNELHRNTGHVFFVVETKSGNKRNIVNNWTIVHDEEEGDLFYCVLVNREIDNGDEDIDSITGLYGKSKFKRYVNRRIKLLSNKEPVEYVIAYYNFVNFKFLNINKGVTEGDQCLRSIADILGNIFGRTFVSRISDDHFAVCTQYEGVMEKTGQVMEAFKENYGSVYNIIGKCGLYKFTPSDDFDFESSLSLAKVACDYIKYDSKVDIVEYSDEFVAKMRLSEYIVRRLDDALDNQWIKVYYQPVINTLTGELCGAESLVRWIDDEVGFLVPDLFIGVLEKNRLIHKLDCYVVEDVCKTIHDRVETGLPVVPISVNFSRLDFIMCDMLDVVEKYVEKYNISKDYIHIEITESMLAEDEGLMRSVIDRFRNAGYEVWMDDFGSGYSSLTLLKDYEFDEIKLDMRFIRPFTEKSKDIVKYMITMTKDLGIKTLAEGVETQEQLDYFKEIGCGKIQGYYYGKPEPIDNMFEHLEEKNIKVQELQWIKFYEAAAFNARATDVPLEVVVDDGVNFKTLFMNKAYMEQVFDDYPELDEVDRRIYHTGSPLLSKYREFADLIEKSDKKKKTIYYTGSGNYYCFKAQVVAECEGYHIIKASIYNISINDETDEGSRLDAKLRELNHLFEVVHLMDIEADSITPLIGRFKYLESYDNDLSMSERFAVFEKENVSESDRDRFGQFVELSSLKERVEQSGGYISDVFNIKQNDGNYRLEEVTVMLLTGTMGREFLFCLRRYNVLRNYDNLLTV